MTQGCLSQARVWVIRPLQEYRKFLGHPAKSVPCVLRMDALGSHLLTSCEPVPSKEPPVLWKKGLGSGQCLLAGQIHGTLGDRKDSRVADTIWLAESHG